MASSSSSARGSSNGSSSESEKAVTGINLLSKEKSPYLLQHAENPVHWFPWGPEAIEKAKDEDKLIFLSVGYSTCHWCHVMERESFEDDHIADIMNEHFVNIKVDREERPDVDKLYMTYVQATTGSGGWPMSVWLTPDLKPVFGGTYFPPNDRYFGQPGFKTILLSLAKQWKEDKQRFYKSGTAVLELLSKHTTINADPKSSVPELKVATKCCQQLMDSYEPQYGGFGKQPKFPQAVNFKFLFHYYSQKPKDRERKVALEGALHTLRMMAWGGIHDHIAQGFHRYSTDSHWHVPHFEKMLYDQGQLAVAYVEAFQITKAPEFEDVARDILLYVDRDMSDETGGFYSAEDADSYPFEGADEKREGAFCVWEKSEVIRLLDMPIQGRRDIKLHQLICDHFNIKDKGNVDPYLDPHDELKEKNVFIIRNPETNTAEKFGISLTVFQEEIKRGCQILFEERKKRPKPHLDDKMLAAWNGLMLSGFARAGQAFGDETYISRAIRAATFIEKHLFQASSETLLRSCYKGEGDFVTQTEHPIPGFVDDYALVIQGLMDLYEACGDDKWLSFAFRLQKLQENYFWDHAGGAHFLTSGADHSILMRLKDDQDGAEPSSNSISVLNLIRLCNFFDDPSLTEKAGIILKAYAQRMNLLPAALPMMVCGLMLYYDKVKKVVIVGQKNSPDTLELLSVVKTNYFPNKVLIVVNGETDSFIMTEVPSTTRLKQRDERATAYVCKGQTCSEPVNTPDQLLNLLSK